MKPFRVLVVDDEEGVRMSCTETLESLPGVHVQAEATASRAAVRLKSEPFNLVLTDIRMQGMDGVKLLRLAKRHDPALQVIMITGYPSMDSVVETMREGASDYLVKPFSAEELQSRVRRVQVEENLKEENRFLARHLEGNRSWDGSPLSSPFNRDLGPLISKIAKIDADVLITGESGTGKELAARALHAKSRRSEGRFVPVNCAAVPDHLLESEFFGYEKGAFTGAESAGLGLFEYAEGGTLFLDEICELAPSLQGKLLRVLQERSFRRVGGKVEIKANVRILAATNRDIEEEVRSKRFREDLYHRINALRVAMAPLRERREDIPLLAADILMKLAAEHGKRTKAVESRAMEILKGHSWPGNIRELQNVLRRALLMGTSPRIRVEDLPEGLLRSSEGAKGTRQPLGSLKLYLRGQETAYLRNLLNRHGGDLAAACDEAHLSKSSFYRLLKRNALDPEDFKK